MKPKIALTIAGSDSGGGAGIQADLKTFSALGVHGLSVITSLTAQNTQAVEGISDVDSEFVKKQIDTIAKDFEINWAKTGMVSDSEIIRTIKKGIQKHGIKVVIDPVMVSASGSSLLKKDALDALKDFLNEATLVTPNTEEASRLTDIEITELEDMKTAAKKISKLGPENVLIKGGHLETEKVHNILLHKNEFTEFQTSRVPTQNVHGTGCTFSAAITAELAKGENLKSAVEKAGDFMINAIKGRLEIGKGADVTNPMAQLWKVTGDGKEIEEVQKAAKKLVNTEEFTNLIPEVGTNIVTAPKNAEKKEDVVGLSGRIIKVSDRPYLSGIPTYGGSEHVANIVLTAMKHDAEIRAAMNIRFSEEILDVCQELDLQVSSFSREEEPPEAKTMKWGTEKAIEEFGGVPDVIYDRGAVGKEPMIRILGKKATEVTKVALKIATKFDSELN